MKTVDQMFSTESLAEVGNLAVFRKQFATGNQYEDWLEEAEGRIILLSITNAPRPFSSAGQEQVGPVTVTYQTRDPSLAPPRSLASRIIQIALVAAVFFAAFLYLTSKF